MLEVQTEQVLVVPTRLFHRCGHFQGFSREVGRYLPELLSLEHTSYRPRHSVEQDPSYKQLIPYVVFRWQTAAGPQLFAYTRGQGQGEGRLHSKRSIGVGGHISQGDGDAHGAAYDEGLRRELDEEVRVETAFDLKCLGLINDDETEVGRVHLGVVHVADVATPAVFPREADICQAGFRLLAELAGDMAAFETWSQICLRALFGVE